MKLQRMITQKGWLTHVWVDFVKTSIEDAVQAGCVLEYDGNSDEGWWVYLREPGTKGVEVSPCFHKDQGDKLRDLKDAFARAYPTLTLRKGRTYF